MNEPITLSDLVTSIETQSPGIIFIGEAHFSDEGRKLAADLVLALKKNELAVGLYLEALYSTADVSKGDYRGDVLAYWDDYLGSEGLNYSKLIDLVKSEVAVHGIDHPQYPGRIKDSESKTRTNWWKKSIDEGKELLKVTLAGAGHYWNDTKKPADILSMMKDPFWLLEPETAYIPPTPFQTIRMEHNSKGYILAKYAPLGN